MLKTEWKYGNDEHPKLEDFMGCCYSTSQDQENKMIINMNALPQDQFPSIQACPYPPDPRSERGGGGESGGVIFTDGGSQPLQCHYSPSPFDGAAISQFKTWLRQTPPTVVGPTTTTPFSGSDDGGGGGYGGCQLQPLSLSMNPDMGPLEVVVDSKKRAQPKSVMVREGRKSLDTFGQRTSQYRGVTKYVMLFLRPKNNCQDSY